VIFSFFHFSILSRVIFMEQAISNAQAGQGSPPQPPSPKQQGSSFFEEATELLIVSLTGCAPKRNEK
jgi:hypothetical protein